jgi:hypothetical protein
MVVIAGSAHATIVFETYQGTVTSGEDFTGVFGAPDTNLAGDQITVRYIIDDATRHAVRQKSPGNFTAIAGRHRADPVSAVITIDGRSFDVAADFYGQATSCAACLLPTLLDQAQTDQHGSAASEAYILANPGTFIPWDYHTPFHYTVQPGDRTYGLFTDGLGGAAASGLYDPTSLVISVVPEPATWTMMLIGLGAMGTTVRRRTRTYGTAQHSMA